MTIQRTLGVIQVTGSSVHEINDALRQLQKRIDALMGLNGRVTIHDRVGVSDPSVDGDAVNQGTLNGYRADTAPPKVADAGAAGTATTFSRSDHTHQGVNLDGAQSLTAVKTFVKPSGWKYVDANGTVIHSFGADP